MTRTNESWEKIIEEKMSKLEKKIEKMGEIVEKKGDEFSKKFEEKTKSISQGIKHGKKDKNHLFWGIAFLIIGFIWMAEILDWVYNIPWMPLLIIIIGVLLIIKGSNSQKTTKTKNSEKE